MKYIHHAIRDILYDVLKSHGLGQLSLTSPAHECNTHDNVLFVGASSQPGNGVPVSVSQRGYGMR
jgi:hypothetical protein